MTDLAKRVVVRRIGGNIYEFTVDGEPFPWYVSDSGFQVSVPNADCPGVTFTLLAERVELVHALDPEPQDQP